MGSLRIALGRARGIPGPMLHRFVNDGLDLRLATADKLVAFFGCELSEPVWDRVEEKGE